jgi:histone H3/H4
MTKLPLAPIKRIAIEGGAQRIGIPAAEAIGMALEELTKRITIQAEKFANHAGRKTVKPEDILVVVKEMGVNIQISQIKPKTKVKKLKPVAPSLNPTSPVIPAPTVIPPKPPTPTPAPMKPVIPTETKQLPL